MLTATIDVSNNADWIQAFQWLDTGIAPPTLQAGGTGYTSAPTVVCSAPVDANGNLIPGGRPALLTASLTATAVSGFTVVDPGAGYLLGFPPSISFLGGAGTGAIAFTTVGNPISLTGSTMTMEVRQTAASVQTLVTVGSLAPNTGITITNASLGQFQIVLPKAGLSLLAPGQSYVHDLVRLRTDGFTERMWTGTLTVDGGVTR